MRHRVGQLIGRAKDLAATFRGVCLDVPNRTQIDSYSCGLCSALMVADFYSIRVPQARISRFDEKHRDGTTAGPLTRFLRGNGLSVRSYSDGRGRFATIINAIDAGMPVIVSVTLLKNLFRREDGEHYIVVCGYDSEYFLVSDPSLVRSLRGRVRRSRFRTMWNRDALVVSKRPRSQRTRIRGRR